MYKNFLLFAAGQFGLCFAFKDISPSAECLIHSFPRPAQVPPATLGFQTCDCPVTSQLFQPSGSQVMAYFLTA